MGSLSRKFAVSRLWLALVGAPLFGLIGFANPNDRSVPASTVGPAKMPSRHTQFLTEKELLAELAAFPEINVAETPEATKTLLDEARRYSRQQETSPPVDLVLEIQKERWKALSISRPDKTVTPRPAALLMASLARDFRRGGIVSMPNGEGGLVDARVPTGEVIVSTVSSQVEATRDWDALGQPTPVPTLVQMLQPEQPSIRAVLVRELARFRTESATIAIARRAIFDPNEDVRIRALKALEGRPMETVRKVLLEGLRHPWPRVAEHAAEALVALNDREAIPALRKLLDEPAPSAAFTPEGGKQPMIRELVRVSHLKNCLLCHAPSNSQKNELSGLIPTPGKPLAVEYYETPRKPEAGDIFVRADVVYVRQDFSVMLRVADAKPWPSRQRFDFVVRTRPATEEEVAAAKKKQAVDSPQWEAALYAMRELKALSEAELTADRP